MAKQPPRHGRTGRTIDTDRLDRVVAEIAREPHSAAALTLYALASTLEFERAGYLFKLVKLRDLSPAGMQLQLTTPLAAGQLVRITCADVATIGRVIYCNRSRHSGQFIAGIAFITVHFPHRTGTFLSENA